MSNTNGSHWIRTAKRLRIYARDGWQCVWCTRPVDREEATLDHFLARNAGGSNAADNLLTACFPCNSKRRHEPALLFAYRIAGPLLAHIVLDRVLTVLARPVP